MPTSTNGTVVRVAEQATLTSAFQTVHTVYKLRFLLITNIHVVNTTVNPVTVRIAIVPPGGTAADSLGLAWDFSVPANDFIEFGDGLLIPSQYTVQASCGTDNAINLFVSGEES